MGIGGPHGALRHETLDPLFPGCHGLARHLPIQKPAAKRSWKRSIEEDGSERKYNCSNRRRLCCQLNIDNSTKKKEIELPMKTLSTVGLGMLLLLMG